MSYDGVLIFRIDAHDLLPGFGLVFLVLLLLLLLLLLSLPTLLFPLALSFARSGAWFFGTIFIAITIVSVQALSSRTVAVGALSPTVAAYGGFGMKRDLRELQSALYIVAAADLGRCHGASSSGSLTGRLYGKWAVALVSSRASGCSW